MQHTTYRELLSAGAQVVMGSSGLFRPGYAAARAKAWEKMSGTVRRAALPECVIKERMMSGKVCVLVHSISTWWPEWNAFPSRAGR